MAEERFEVQRTIAAEPSEIFAVVSDPQGHVAIDASGMLQAASGERPTAVGDEFVVHMDREALNDFPLGKYDVTVRIVTFEADREIAWTIEGVIQPPIAATSRSLSVAIQYWPGASSGMRFSHFHPNNSL